MGLFWTTGNNYGREAAAFLNIKMSLYLTGTSLNNCNKQRVFFGQLETTTAAKRPLSWLLKCHYIWQEQLRPRWRSGRIGHLLRTTTVAKRPPFYWWTNRNNYGREAAAFLNSTLIINNGSFLENWMELRPRSGYLFIGQLGTTIAAAFLN